jgi:hypothetical protein
MTVRLDAFRHDLGRAVTHEEFIEPLAIHLGEVEEAVVFGEPRCSGEVRFWSARREGVAVKDTEFNAWAADGFRAAVRFLEQRQPSVFAALKAGGLDIRVCIEVSVVGEFPIIDWPETLYGACRIHGIGLVSMWPSPDEAWCRRTCCTGRP